MMEQRSQMLKQMQLSKNEREREVRVGPAARPSQNAWAPRLGACRGQRLWG